MYKENLQLNDLQWLIYRQTKLNQIMNNNQMIIGFRKVSPFFSPNYLQQSPKIYTPIEF